MQTQSTQTEPKTGRREFLKQSSLGAVGAMLATTMNVPLVHAAENNMINVALVGCGGRGSGAVLDALRTEGPKKVVALADVFPARVAGALQGVTEQFPADSDIPQDRQFVGFDGYKHAIDAVGPGGVVLLGSPPCFRPLHLEYAVEKGVHVFMEKSFAVDPPGVHRILKAGEAAKAKNLKIVGGLMTRHKRSMQEAITQIRNGIIGDVMTCWAYRMHGPIGLGGRRENESLLSHQIRNYSNFTWINGSPLLDWLIHNLDVCCWAKDAYPVVAQGQCGRRVRKDKDQIYDQYAVEYAFADGTRFHAQGRFVQDAWYCFQATIHGTTGCAIFGEGIGQPRIYRGHNPEARNMIWEYTGPEFRGEYQAEQDVLFDAIRNDKPHNEAERCAYTTMTGILGRLACDSGQRISWDDAFKSEKSLANVEALTSFDSPAPVQPDENGDYPFPIPGQTEVL